MNHQLLIGYRVFGAPRFSKGLRCCFHNNSHLRNVQSYISQLSRYRQNVYYKELNKGRFPLAHRFRGLNLWLHSLINHAEGCNGRSLCPKGISLPLGIQEVEKDRRSLRRRDSQGSAHDDLLPSAGPTSYYFQNLPKYHHHLRTKL